MAKLTPENVRDAIDQSGGIVSHVAKRLGCSRQGLYKWLGKNPELGRAIFDERERLLDKAESNLAVAVEAGHLGASMYVLSTLGKDRGYSRRIEANESPRPMGNVIIIDSKPSA